MPLLFTSAREAARRPEAPRPGPPYCLLLIVVLLALPSLAAAQYKTERPPYNEFLNYGKKIVKPGDELGNEIIKSKVDVLGAIFKQHVHRLRQVYLRVLTCSSFPVCFYVYALYVCRTKSSLFYTIPFVHFNTNTYIFIFHHCSLFYLFIYFSV